MVPCPGRGAAFLTLLRRAGTVPNTGVRYGPGSAAHRFALRSVRGTASRQADIALADLTRSRSMNFWILPVDVFGIGPNTTVFGALNPGIWPRQNAMMSASLVLALSFSSTKAQGTSPHFASGFATTAANST